MGQNTPAGPACSSTMAWREMRSRSRSVKDRETGREIINCQANMRIEMFIWARTDREREKITDIYK